MSIYTGEHFNMLCLGVRVCIMVGSVRKCSHLFLYWHCMNDGEGCVLGMECW